MKEETKKNWIHIEDEFDDCLPLECASTFAYRKENGKTIIDAAVAIYEQEPDLKRTYANLTVKAVVLYKGNVVLDSRWMPLDVLDVETRHVLGYHFEIDGEYQEKDLYVCSHVEDAIYGDGEIELVNAIAVDNIAYENGFVYVDLKRVDEGFPFDLRGGTVHLIVTRDGDPVMGSSKEFGIPAGYDRMRVAFRVSDDLDEGLEAYAIVVDDEDVQNTWMMRNLADSEDDI